MTRVTFWTESGPQVGYGHLRRCLAVADAARAKGADTSFLLNDPAGRDLATRGGHAADAVPRAGAFGTLDVVVADGRTIDARALAAIRPSCRRLAVFDDGCRRPSAPVDVVIDPAPGADRLPHRAPERLLGPRYFPMASAFRAAAGGPRGSAVVASFGGSDPEDLSATFAAAAHGRLEATLVLGPGYGGALREGPRAVRDPPDLAERFARAAVVVATAGGTALELAALGTPAVLVPVAEDQHANADHLARVGAAVVAKDAAEAVEAAARLLASPERRAAMTGAARDVVDLFGAERVAAALLGGEAT